ncbi:MAG: [FeFe] hydrogenase H-cluster radical SAM maturase HydE [Bacteroidota bacterium]
MVNSAGHSKYFFNEEALQDRERLLELIGDPGGAEARWVLAASDQLRAETVGDAVHLRGLIEFSNYCRNDCLYCGLRRENRKVSRYRMDPREIVAAAEEGAKLGFKTLVLQSGEDPAYSGEMIAEIIREIKGLGLVVTLSIGERESWEYELWRSAGAERYLMRHETADPLLYERLHPGRSFVERVSRLKILKELDYQVGTGFMVGLPGQKRETLYADLELALELEAEMVGIGPFIPHPDTPLGKEPGGTLEQTCLMVALTRLALPYALIPATTALGSISPLGREAALRAGANVVMPNLTPQKYRPDYQIYPNKICQGEEAAACRGCITRRIEGMGRIVADDPGHNQIWLKRRGRDCMKS